MKNLRSSFLKTLLPLGALFGLVALGACKDTVVIGGNAKPCNTDVDCPNGQICTAAGVCSGGACKPEAEACDGIDNDCDGTVDDGALCVDGTVCQNGACGAPCQPAPETCDGVDNDCDGAVDDGSGMVLCPNGGSCVNGACVQLPCSSPNGGCPPGQACDANGNCVPGGCVPWAESCNGIDDDCDGVIDDDDPNAPLCSDGGVCTNGNCSWLPCDTDADCPAGQLCLNGACTAVGCLPAPEQCDGEDNDCDGLVDNVSDPNVPLCLNGGTCVNGACMVYQCQVDSDCPVNTACVNGICQ
ncbi:MopE-related protein [Polyangium aurulentum]|uniref:MopE-related protein n=1 Tax=Polyangium aurulentum TaxID=2567896 RepID=UPI001F370A65|nr:MopE-related protein [Polyangium aurulentum]